MRTVDTPMRGLGAGRLSVNGRLVWCGRHFGGWSADSAGMVDPPGNLGCCSRVVDTRKWCGCARMVDTRGTAFRALSSGVSTFRASEGRFVRACRPFTDMLTCLSGRVDCSLRWRLPCIPRVSTVHEDAAAVCSGVSTIRRDHAPCIPGVSTSHGHADASIRACRPFAAMTSPCIPRVSTVHGDVGFVRPGVSTFRGHAGLCSRTVDTRESCEMSRNGRHADDWAVGIFANGRHARDLDSRHIRKGSTRAGLVGCLSLKGRHARVLGTCENNAGCSRMVYTPEHSVGISGEWSTPA